ncbi:MAG: hypothetical protein KDA57_24340, partial [Planctomycetales bacterium]|nr:hypothetical protein [Planctomycetales bacterium]
GFQTSGITVAGTEWGHDWAWVVTPSLPCSQGRSETRHSSNDAPSVGSNLTVSAGTSQWQISGRIGRLVAI